MFAWTMALNAVLVKVWGYVALETNGWMRALIRDLRISHRCKSV
ncbi:MAG: hypothetical protein ACKOOI_18020 [Pirellula sp.]